MLTAASSPLQTRHNLLRMWPLGLLLLAEGLGLALAAGQPPTRLSVTIAALVLLCGLLPALLRPGPETLLAGCLAAVLASILITPIQPDALPGPFQDRPMIKELPGHLLVRLLNGAALSPLAFHLTARFPRRSRISNRRLAGLYLVSFTLLAALLLVNVKAIRLALFVVLPLWMFGLLAAAFWLLLKNSRLTAPEDARAAQQARLLFFTLLLAEAPAMLRPVGLILRTELISYDLFLAAQILLPAGIAYTILRHDLFGIDMAVRRGFAYAMLSLLLLAVYFGLTVTLTAALAGVWPQALSLLLAAVLFEPSRRSAQRLVDRVLYPDRLNFQRALVHAQATLGRVVSREEVIHLLVDDLPPRLGAEWANLSLAPAPDVPGGSGRTPAWNAQLMVAGKALGRYWLGPRRTGPSYDREEQAQLHALAQQAALALAYAEAFEALAELNRELEGRVAQRTEQVLAQQRALAAFAERQRLARDLHDSVTQALFSINLSARALRGLVHRDPPAAVSGLSDLEGTAQQALGEMRSLLAQLRSPLPALPAEGQAAQTDSVNLAERLAAHCAGLRREAGPDGEPPLLAVNLDAPGGLLLPAAQASELLLIAKEALHNAARHSGVRQATCRLTQEGEQLCLLVADQGQGFDLHTSQQGGFGLAGMQERVAGLGGTLNVQSEPGAGTTVLVQVPVRANTEERSLP